MTRLSTWWTSYGPGQRILAVGLWLIAFALTGFGLYGDQHSWWVTRPFATNLVSSAAGACFGVPVAIFVLQALASRQSHDSERRRAIQTANRNAVDMVEAARTATMLPAGPEEHEWLAALVRTAEDLRSRGQVLLEQGLPIAEQAVECASLAEAVAAVLADGTVRKETMDSAISVVSLKWQLLRGDVRERLAECGIGWIGLHDEQPFVRALADAEATDTDVLSAAAWGDLGVRLRGYRHSGSETAELVRLAQQRAGRVVPAYMALAGLRIATKELQEQLAQLPQAR